MAQRDTGQNQIIDTVQFPQPGQPWGALDKYDLFSRYCIPDTDFDQLDNWMPMGSHIRQILGHNATLATLASTAIWVSAQTLNLAQYLFCLCQNGHIYQVSLGGTIVDVTGATSMASTSDISNWRGTTILFTDPSAQKIYSWDGTTFATVFTVQPESIIAVYAGRLWMAQNNVITFTAGNTFNSLGGDSGSFTITESTCQPPIIALYPFQGSLYIFGYDWVQILNNVQSVGAPAVVTFSIQMVENNVGTISRWSIIGLGSTLYWANQQGIWELQGTFPQKVSKPIDGYYQNLSASSFSVAFGYIWNIPCLFWQLATAADSNKCVFGLTIEGQWFRTVLNQETFIASTVDQTTGLQKVFGTSGAALFQMFANTAATVSSVAGFKYWDFGSSSAFKRIYKYGATLMFTGAATYTLAIFDDSGNALTLPYGNSFSYTPTLVFVGAGTITFTGTGAITWTVNANTWSNVQLGVAGNDICRRFGSQVTVSGSGTMLETVNIEREIEVVKWN